jgi:hypothetical protein
MIRAFVCAKTRATGTKRNSEMRRVGKWERGKRI